MKKLLATAGAGALLLASTGFVFAGCPGQGCHPPRPQPEQPDVLTVNNWASVNNTVKTKADSGDNHIAGFCVHGGAIKTGSATAWASSYNDVNSSLVGCPNCFDKVHLHNWGSVNNTVKTKADSGDNGIYGLSVGGGWVNTGAAGATSTVTNMVNFSWVNGPSL